MKTFLKPYVDLRFFITGIVLELWYRFMKLLLQRLSADGNEHWRPFLDSVFHSTFSSENFDWNCHFELSNLFGRHFFKCLCRRTLFGCLKKG